MQSGEDTEIEELVKLIISNEIIADLAQENDPK